jgi:hypothetical protein
MDIQVLFESFIIFFFGGASEYGGGLKFRGYVVKKG